VPQNANQDDELSADARPQVDHLAADAKAKPHSFPTSDRENDRLRDLKGRYTGERIFVLGNDVSLKNTDLSLLKKEFTFAVDRIHDKGDLCPTFLTCSDDTFVADHRSDIVDVTTLGTPTVFMPTRFRQALAGSDSLYHYNLRNSEGEFDGFALDITDGATMGSTVLSPVLQLAHYMGFSPIYLIGTDLDSTTDQPEPQDVLPVDKDEDCRSQDPGPLSVEQELAVCSNAIESAGGRLRNASAGGDLPGVARVDYASLFTRKSGKLVSIVLPAYNAGPFIQETIESVQRQTYEDWELIVVDDGSTDDTAQKVRAYLDLDDRVKLIRQANAGKSAARNAGLDAATGDFVTFVDADDSFLIRKLEIQVDLLRRSPNIDVVVGGHVRTDQVGQVLTATTRVDGTSIELPRYAGGCPFSLFTALFRSSVLKTIRFDIGRQWGEDWEFLLRFAGGLETPVMQHSEIVARYRMTPQALSKVNRQFAEAHISIVDEGLHRVLDEKQWVRFYPAARREVGMRLAGRLAACGHPDDASSIFGDTMALDPNAEFDDYRRAFARSATFWREHLAVPIAEAELNEVVHGVMEEHRESAA